MFNLLNNNYIKVFICLSASSLILFYLFPNLDLWITNIFYTQNRQFFLEHHNIAKFLYDIVPYIVKTLIALYFIAFIVVNIIKKKLLFLDNKTIIYLTLALIIGPGLTVNTIFKDQVFGRARPKQITEFGGEKSFSPPFIIAKECIKNCSFVSGHASVGFYLTSFAYLIRKKFLANTVFYGAVLFGFAIGGARIVQGGHFFSDVIFSGFIVIAINYLLYILLFSKT